LYKEILDVEGAATLLGVSTTTIYNPTTTLYLALGLSALSMRKVGTVIALLQPGD
jgi:hypothetical protein